MPFTVATHDKILGLAYIYHGPVIDVPWLPWELRFRGRPLPEWAALAAALPVMWVVVDAIMVALDATGLSAGSFESHAWAVAHAVGTWVAASQIASFVYRHLVNTDRSLRYLWVTAHSEAKRLLWARGPIDPAVIAAGAPLWLVVVRGLGATPLPYLAAWPLAALIAVPAARALVAAFEPPERARARIVTRAHRRSSNAAVTVGGSQ